MINVPYTQLSHSPTRNWQQRGLTQPWWIWTYAQGWARIIPDAEPQRGELVTAQETGKTSSHIICSLAYWDGFTIVLPASGLVLLLSIFKAATKHSFKILNQSMFLLCLKTSSGSCLTLPYNTGHARPTALSPCDYPHLALSPSPCSAPPDPGALLAAPTLQAWH